MSTKYVYGFGIIDAIESQFGSATASVGMISDYSRTFVKNGLEYSNTEDISGRFFMMKGIDEDGEDYTYSTIAKEGGMDMVAGVAALTSEDTMTAAVTELCTQLGFTLIDIGQSITLNGVTYPGSVNFSAIDGDDTIEFMIWFSDALIRSDWSFSEVVVVSPFDDPIVLFDTYAAVSAEIASVDLTELFDDINTAQGKEPATKIGIRQITWQDPSDSSKSLKISFGYVGYGPKATLGSIQDEAWRDYLLANTSKTMEEWVEYFPSIDNVNSFTLFPMWQNEAVSVLGTVVTRYASIIDMKEIINDIFPLVFGNDDTRTNEEISRLSIFPHIFKGVMVVGLADASNGDEMLSLTSVVPDYIVLDINNSGLSEVEPMTLDLIDAMNTVLTAAEVDDGTQTLDSPMVRSTYDDFDVIEYQYEAVLLRVTTKASWLAISTTS